MNSQKNFHSFSLFFPLLLFLILNCAAFPELERPRTDRVTRLPDFSPFYGLKRRIAVLNFENNTGHGSEKLGSAVSDMLITQLVRSNRFILIERSRIEQILQEQALGQSGAITEVTAPKVGQLLGVESLIIGQVVKADQETGSRKIEDEKDKWKLLLKATLGIAHISYKMISATTGEILLADNISATELKPGFGIETKDIDFENIYDFDQTVVGIAVRKAVNKMAQDIVDKVEVIDWVGKVVQSQADTTLYFTPGQGAGVQLEQMFDIFETVAAQAAEQLSTEETIMIEHPKARVVVTGFIGDRVARAKVIQGGGIKRGDLVKLAKR